MLEKIKENWDNILGYIKNNTQMGEISFNTWILPLAPEAVCGDSLYLLYRDNQNEGFKNYVEASYSETIATAIFSETSINFDKANIHIISDASEIPSEDIVKPVTVKEEKISPKVEKDINEKYTFNNFVVGSNNRFAHAASLAVAESPGTVYNPLYLYGGSGLGKTHLMNSIVHYVQKHDPSKKIMYVTSEAFLNEFVQYIQKRTPLEVFRNNYRNVDILLIDDIQFLGDKQGIQEEFFHTFNALYSANKQIVISSDKPPKDLTTLEERIRSRFSQGLTADISAPDFETRLAILRKKEEDEGYNIDNEVLKYIASNIKSNIRELEGALKKIISLSKLYHMDNITLDLARDALKDFITPEEKKDITLDYIIKVVAEHYSLTPDDLKSIRKNKEIADPRHIAVYLCKTLTPSTYQAIGDALGKRDHATIMSSYNKMCNILKEDEAMKLTMDTLIKKINT
ncbi:MAG: chromosomal replication initiator protein DnaA [Lachnospiraceae bacterium]|nr:chromosomal replication initiator protein DnaA [Lachnospiraceae bacterium]